MRPRRLTHMPLMLATILSFLAVGLVALPVANAQEEPRFRALVYSKVTNFFHQSIPYGKAAIQQLADENNFEVVVSDDSAEFTDDNLATFDVVVFNNTNSTPQAGDLLNAEQRAAFQRYIRGGGGYTGIHSASGTERDWEWYGNLVGAFFRSHPAIQELEVEVDDRVHPSTRDLPQSWIRTEEPYDFTLNPRGNVHVLASYDTTTYDGHVMGADHPISWCQNFEGGRSWYTGMGHSPSAFTEEPLFLQHILGGIEWAAGAVEGDCGATDEERFEKIQLDGNTDDPLELEVDETGRVFYVQRGGAVKVFDPVTQRTTVAAELEVLVNHTHGVHGLALDPGFAENHWMYIYYSPLEQDVSLVSRFTFDEATSTLDLDSEQVLLEINSQRDVNAHEGGGMDFDADGNLYVGTGDNSLPCCSGYGPIDERPGQEYEDAQRSSGNTNDLRGKILRIHPEPDGTYTIPEGNLFPPGTEATRPEVYTMGLRQPYRLHIDQETGWLYWGDVGPDARVDSDTRGSKGYDEWNQARGPGNFGWPYCVGANHPYIDYDFATGESGEAFDCEGGPTNDSPNNTGLTTLPPAQPAWIAYSYDPTEEWPELGEGGRLAIGGPTYHFDPDLASEAKFPEYYDDTVFVSAWTRNAIFEVKLDSEGRAASMNRFMPNETFLRPIDMEFGPDGSLYLIEWGSNYGGSGRGDPNFDSGIYKINYVVPGQRSPVARASADPTSGQPPLTVQFDSSGSQDPDAEVGDTITYAWDLNGDGTTDSTEPNPTHTYTERGDYPAQLRVTDTTGRSDVANIPITVGNTAPTVEMVEPVDGQFFTQGEEIDYLLRVTDAEDGSSEEGTIDCEQVITQPRLGHDEHGHPLEQYPGCSGTFPTILDEGHGPNDNIYYIVDSTYTDQGGEGASRLTGGDSVILQPRQKQAEHWTSAGDIALYDTREGDGGRMVGQIGHGDFLSFEPINLRGITQMTFRVASAGTGGDIEIRLDSVDGPVVGTARVEPTGHSYEFTTVTTQVTDPGGSHELFLVFTNNPGDGYLFNLDWMRFENPLTDPLREARRALDDLEQAAADHADALNDDQETYIADLVGEADGYLNQALEAGPEGDGFRASVEDALATLDRGRTWITMHRDGGRIETEVAAALLEPLGRALAEVTSVVGAVDGAKGAVSLSAPEVAQGETVRVEVSLRNDGEDTIRAAEVDLDVPEGWQATQVAATRDASLPPGATLTGMWDLTAPVTAEPGAIELTGHASYRHRGRARVVLPLSATLNVVHAVEVTGISADLPLYAGSENPVTITVTNRRSQDPVAINATIDAPAGWQVGTATETVPAGEAVEVDVPVTPPAGPPPAGILSDELAAAVTATDVAVAGAPGVAAFAVPPAEDVALAIDAGTPTSPLFGSYSRLSPADAWDEARGYGWVGAAPQNRDRGAPDLIRRDMVTSPEPAVLRIQVPPGVHEVAFLRGDNNYASTGMLVEVDGEIVVPNGPTVSVGQFAWERFSLDGGAEGRAVDLRMSNNQNEFWKILTFLLYNQEG